VKQTDATYFLDFCGYEGALPDTDDFIYRYYLGGTTGDGTTNPLNNLPDESFFPPLAHLLKRMLPQRQDALLLPQDACELRLALDYCWVRASASETSNLIEERTWTSSTWTSEKVPLGMRGKERTARPKRPACKSRHSRTNR